MTAKAQTLNEREQIYRDALEAIIAATYGTFPDKASYLAFIRDIAQEAVEKNSTKGYGVPR